MATADNKALIHYCTLHCTNHVQRGPSDALYTLAVYRLPREPSERNGLRKFELWAYWGRRGYEQKGTYKGSGWGNSMATALDSLIAGQEAKGYVIVVGGKVGKNIDYWEGAPDLGVPHVISTGQLPAADDLGQPVAQRQFGGGNTGSGAAPSAAQRASGQHSPRPQPSYEPSGPIGRAMERAKGAGSFAEALATPLEGTARDRQRRQDFAELDAAAELDRLRKRLAELEGQPAAVEPGQRVTRRITLED